MSTLTDSKGHDWHPVIHGKMLSDWGRACDVDVSDLIKMDLNAGALIDAIWFSCRDEVQDEFPKMQKSAFLERFNVIDTFKAIEGVMAAFKDQIPEADAATVGEQNGDSPLDAVGSP